jgi:hypothetical protein
MAFCAPTRTGRNDTCFDADELEILAHAWNHTALGLKRPIFIPENEPESMRKKMLHDALSQRFSTYCRQNESCWLDNIELNESLKQISPELHKDIHSSILKPKGTQGKSDWLSTVEIDAVLQQFEKLFDDFKYVGCYPSDYFRLYPEAFPFSAFNKYRQLGLVLNLDSSDQPGSHWVAIFFENIGHGETRVEYFDATGRPPNTNIEDLLSAIQTKLPGMQYSENDFPHQRGNNECGVYSLYFILERLTGTPFEQLGRKRIKDSSMNRFREFLFRPFSEEFSWRGGAKSRKRTDKKRSNGRRRKRVKSSRRRR